jgi:hypothetical protein
MYVGHALRPYCMANNDPTLAVEYSQMPIGPRSRLGPYEIAAQNGKGGMGDAQRTVPWSPS